MYRGLVLTLLFFVAFSVSGAETCDSLKSLEWLLGDWISRSEASSTSESWRSVSELTWEGLGETRSTESGELKNQETLRLTVMSGEVFYWAKVKHNARPVAFTLTECSNQLAVFENPDHDFPKKLEYRLTSPKRIEVQVTDGADQGFSIHFEKESVP